MARVNHCVFETVSGFAAIGWGPGGISSFRLPAPTHAGAKQALFRRFPQAVAADPSEPVRRVIDDARRYFSGERIDFSSAEIDIGEQAPFFARVYALVRKLGWGETTTYGAVARELGEGPEAARAVGQAMAGNPVPLIIPCHRVTAAGGKIGGFSAPGGAMSKARMLELEGVMLAQPEKAAQIGFGF